MDRWQEAVLCMQRHRAVGSAEEVGRGVAPPRASAGRRVAAARARRRRGSDAHNRHLLRPRAEQRGARLGQHAVIEEVHAAGVLL